MNYSNCWNCYFFPIEGSRCTKVAQSRCTPDTQEKFVEVGTMDTKPLFNSPSEWAKAMEDGDKFEDDDYIYYYDPESNNLFKRRGKKNHVYHPEGVVQGMGDGWSQYNKVTKVEKPNPLYHLSDEVNDAIKYLENDMKDEYIYSVKKVKELALELVYKED